MSGDRNGKPFRAGLYEYKGGVSNWLGAKFNMVGIDESNNYIAFGTVAHSTGKMGSYNEIGCEIEIALWKLARDEDGVVIADIFNYNFKPSGA